jgi:hypothetical protein
LNLFIFSVRGEPFGYAQESPVEPHVLLFLQLGIADDGFGLPAAA